MPDQFLARAGWSDAVGTPLAGDASGRLYTRLTRGAESAVLMESCSAPVGPFLTVAAHLEDLNLSAPRIMAVSEKDALVLMEDLGDDIFARVVAADPAAEAPLGESVIQVLAMLQAGPVPAWAASYDAHAMTDALEPAWSHAARPNGPVAECNRLFRGLLAEHGQGETVLLHRDFHAENLVWLPGREGARRVGLLDFQDALAGHPAYDLASYLQDARRDVSPETEAWMLDRFCAVTHRDRDTFGAAYALQSLQRNVRILGLFARLAERGRTGYLAHVPRVRGYVERSLAHPAAAPLAGPLRDCILTPVAA
ncbi:aminoglycoside phosphotransferase family protein [Palleronia sp.]|uniref:aminoglycoside phosphotransferase family protein n=1 Tax=Palleronia sp. TaxID=1940284 RepID=UPI0035C8140F